MAASEVARRRPASKSICVTDEPTAQKRLDPISKFPIEVPSKPAEAFSTTVGKKAARAMPICSFASAARRSAAAMSGRRSSSCDGRPTGIAGGWLSNQDGDRVFELRPLHGDIGSLHTRGIKLRFGLGHIGHGGGASCETIRRELQGGGEGVHRVVQQQLL